MEGFFTRSIAVFGLMDLLWLALAMMATIYMLRSKYELIRLLGWPAGAIIVFIRFPEVGVVCIIIFLVLNSFKDFFRRVYARRYIFWAYATMGALIGVFVYAIWPYIRFIN